MKDIKITKGIYKIKINVKGNEGYGFDDPAEVFHLDYTSVIEVKNDTILTKDILFDLFKDKFPKFGEQIIIVNCKIDDVTELYNTYMCYKKDYDPDLLITNYDKWKKLYNLISDLAIDITGEYIDIDEEDIKIKSIGE